MTCWVPGDKVAPLSVGGIDSVYSPRFVHYRTVFAEVPLLDLISMAEPVHRHEGRSID